MGAAKINTEALLGRKPVSIKTDGISALICDKVCMVTGGGGSIGSELCRQIMRCHPRLLVIVEAYENNAYAISTELYDTYGENAPTALCIASVRDKAKLERLFKKYKPQLVFHAAAYKHLPLMEFAADEAVKNNIFGTYNVAFLSKKYKAERFLLISTDKAVHPTSVMGATKRCCEQIVKQLSADGGTLFVSVRFGNVLESNGSVIPRFKKQIRRGGPVTVTHPDATRYFMTIPEAVSLVLEACRMARRGDIFVLDMGVPVNILALARRLIEIYAPDKDIEIVFTGLRAGEKLTEELVAEGEASIPTDNAHIYIGKQIELPRDFDKKLQALKKAADGGERGIITALCDAVPDFTPDKIHFKI